MMMPIIDLQNYGLSFYRKAVTLGYALVGLSLVLLSACQVTPYSRYEDPHIFINNTMQTLKKQADPNLTVPENEEYRLIHQAVLELMLQKDERYFSVIALLKKQKTSLMVNEAKRLARSSEAKKEPAFAQQLKYYALAALCFLDPLAAQTQLNHEIDHPDNPVSWKQLAQLLNQRLEQKKNKIVRLRKQLLLAEAKKDAAQQLQLHTQLFNLNEQLQQRPDMIFHLNRILALSPKKTSAKRAMLERLGQIYVEQGNQSLAQNLMLQALDIARALNESAVIVRLENALGIVSIAPDLKQYASQQKSMIDALERTDKEQYTSETWLTLASYYQNMGKTQQAEIAAINGLSLARKENNLQQESLAIRYLGDLARVAGNLQRALTQYTLALKLYTSQNKTHEALLLQSKVAMMTLFLTHTEQAVDILNQMLEKTQDESFRWQYGKALAKLAIVESMTEKKFDENHEKWQKGLAIIRESKHVAAEEEVLGEAAIVIQSFNQAALAIQYYQQAAQLARQQSRYFQQAKYLTNLALAYQRHGQHTLALNFLKQATAILEILDSDLLLRVQELLAITLNKLKNN